MDLREILALFLLGLGLSLSQMAVAAGGDVGLDGCGGILTPMSDAQLAAVYIKHAMPKYFSHSEVKSVPGIEQLDEALREEGPEGMRKRQVLNAVQSQLDLYGREYPSIRRTHFDRLLVVTHPLEGQQPKIADLLLSRPYSKIFNLQLISRYFPLKDRRLTQLASFYQVSDSGRLARPVTAGEFIFVGGNARECLAETVSSVIAEAERSGLPQITLRFLPRYIYEMPGVRMLKDLNKYSSETDFFAFLNKSVLAKSIGRLTVQSGTFAKNDKMLVGTYRSLGSPLKINVLIEK